MGRTFIIAEAGDNHNGRLDLAFQLIDKAVEAGADCVKFQTFVTEELVSMKAGKAEYQKEATGSNESQYEMLKKLELSFDGFKQLQEYSVWYADYEIIPQTPYAFEFLQYSESGCVDGIEGPVDLNLWFIPRE